MSSTEQPKAEKSDNQTAFTPVLPNDMEKKKPVVIIVIGMAGSGKTTLMQRFNSHLHSQGKPPYILNLDPAVSHMPYSANIDIRDTVDYKEVMKQYNLGPNGGILTALNLFTTKFDQVLGFVEKRAETVEYILIDTPGQIEIFTWSASGSIITDALASSLPTVIAYVIDTPRTTSPITFMSNMLYACSILYKTRLPFILLFNKIDAEPHDFAIDWIRNFDSYQAALNERGREEGSDGEMGYSAGLMGSMCLVLEEFYNNLKAVGVSAMTGQGMRDLFQAVEEGRKEYESDYLPEIKRLAEERKTRTEADKKAQMERMMKDMNVGGSSSGVGKGGKSKSEYARRKEKGGGNPFGPFARNEREDRYYDDDHGDSGDDSDEDEEEVDEDERKEIRRQMEMEEEAEHAEDVDVNDLGDLEPGSGGVAGGRRAGRTGMSWPSPM